MQHQYLTSINHIVKLLHFSATINSLSAKSDNLLAELCLFVNTHLLVVTITAAVLFLFASISCSFSLSQFDLQRCSAPLFTENEFNNVNGGVADNNTLVISFFLPNVALLFVICVIFFGVFLSICSFNPVLVTSHSSWISV